MYAAKMETSVCTIVQANYVCLLQSELSAVAEVIWPREGNVERYTFESRRKGAEVSQSLMQEGAIRNAMNHVWKTCMHRA